MSLSKPFLKETKPPPYSARGAVQIVAQCSDLTEGPVGLEGSIQGWGPGLLYPWGHTFWTLFGQLILGEKAE